MIFPSPSSQLDLFQILYLIPGEPEDVAASSPFQGFTQNFLNAAPILAQVAELPSNVYELVWDFPKRVGIRVARGGYAIATLATDALGAALNESNNIFCCVCSMSDTVAARAATTIAECERPVMHVAPEGVYGAVSPGELNRAGLRRFALDVVSWLIAERGVELDDLRSQLEAEPASDEPSIPLNPRQHFITHPNEATLRAVGCMLAERADPPIGASNEPYFETIRDSVDAISELRREILAQQAGALLTSPYEIILAAPSILKDAQNIDVGKHRGDKYKRAKMIRKFLKDNHRGKTFMQQGSGKEVAAMLKDDFVRHCIGLRSKELELFCYLISITSSSNFAPAIRLPPSVNATRTELADLSQTKSWSNSKRSQKLSRVAKRLSQRLKADVPTWVVDRVKECNRVKLIADAPLEWLPIGGLPLVLKTVASRIPTTPGNLFALEALATTDVVVPQSAFEDVLVIRSFDANDPLRSVTETAIETMREGREGPPHVTIVDVEDGEELVQALEGFNGAMMIYDGHGKHDRKDDVGTLALSNEHVNVWDLRGRVRIPPVVILSACDTNLFGASHVTTANGFLTAGAVTVLGTSLPVGGVTAATFVARLLYRIQDLMPALLSRPPKSIRWHEFFAGMQRRQYASEALDAVAQPLGLVKRGKWFGRILEATGIAIELGDTEWYDVMVGGLARESGRSAEIVRETIGREAYLTDALLYVQLGNPERVVIAQDPSQYPSFS